MDDNYELMIVLAPDLKEEQLTALKTQVAEEITALGATIEKEDFWGKRDLAFEVKDFHSGFYHLIKFTSPTDVPNKIKGMLKVNEKIIRYLISKRIIWPEPSKLEEIDKKAKPKEKPRTDAQPKLEDLFIAETKEAEKKEEE